MLIYNLKHKDDSEVLNLQNAFNYLQDWVLVYQNHSFIKEVIGDDLEYNYSKHSFYSTNQNHLIDKLLVIPNGYLQSSI